MAMTGDKLQLISVVQNEKGGDREENLPMCLVKIIPFLELEYWDRHPKVVWDKNEEMEMFILLTRKR